MLYVLKNKSSNEHLLYTCIIILYSYKIIALWAEGDVNGKNVHLLGVGTDAPGTVQSSVDECHRSALVATLCGGNWKNSGSRVN